MGHLADKLTGLSNSCWNPQSACQWTHISGSWARDREGEREGERYSFVFSILYVSGTLVSGFWFDNLHGFSGCVSILFCISFRLYRQLLFFFRFFSHFFGGSEKIFSGLSKFLKNSVVVVVAFVYKQTVFVFPFCCPNQHLEYQLPSERDA